MSTTTTNYDLIKPDASDLIDIGDLNNNFDTIDQELKNCLDAASLNISSNLLRYTVELSGTWTGEDPYTQIVTIPDAIITPNSKVDLQPDTTVLSAMLANGVKALWIENNNGVLTARAIGGHPSVALTVQCTISDTGTILASIQITEEPTKEMYASGTALDLTGLEVTATYADGSSAIVTDLCTSVPADGQSLTASGTQEVVVSYSYNGTTKSDTFDVEVVASVSFIEVTNSPTKISYVQGETLDLTGIEITATYTNEETADVTEDCVFNPDDGDELSVIGLQSILVSYTENGVTKTLTFNVDVVAPNLSSIAITSMPTTTSYTVGDALDITGLEVTATYANGDTLDVTSRCVLSPDDGDILSVAGNQAVSVAYSEDDIVRVTSFTVSVS